MIASQAETKRLSDLLTKVYNQFIDQFHTGTLKFPYDYERIEPQDFEKVMKWCMGMSQGLALRKEFWLQSDDFVDMDEDEEKVAVCISIVEACFDIDNVPRIIACALLNDPKVRDEGFDRGEMALKMFGLLPGAVEGLTLIGARNITEGSKTATPNKVGRNEPCPCGCGKKSKKCCGGSSMVIH